MQFDVGTAAKVEVLAQSLDASGFFNQPGSSRLDACGGEMQLGGTRFPSFTNRHQYVDPASAGVDQLKVPLPITELDTNGAQQHDAANAMTAEGLENGQSITMNGGTPNIDTHMRFRVKSRRRWALPNEKGRNTVHGLLAVIHSYTNNLRKLRGLQPHLFKQKGSCLAGIVYLLHLLVSW